MNMALYTKLESFLKNPENSADTGSCMSECPGTGQLNFQKGYRYIYSYSTGTSTFLQGSSAERSHVVLECSVHIEVMGKCHMVLKLRDVHLKATVTSKQGSQKEFDSLRDILEEYPLQFSYNDGKIQRICPKRQEPTWSLNVKRGILSVLQGNLKAPSTGRAIEEVDILGRCPTTYELKGNSLWKKKYLNQCSNRVLGSSSLQSVALPDKTQILDSHLECMQTFKDGILAETTCNESHLVTIYSREGNGAKTQTLTVLKLLKKEVDTSLNKEILGNVYVANLLYEKDVHSSKLRGDEVAETVRNLCLAPNMNFETADLFMTLVFELRLLSADALSDLWQRSSFKCRDNWQPLLDALPSCGTEACVGLMKDILLSKELEDEKIESFLWSLAFIPEPTAGMIASVSSLLQETGAGQNAYLAVTALVHHFCLSTKDCHEIPEVQAVMRTLQGLLGDNCAVQEPDEIHKVQLVLKAVGNAGLAAASLIPTLANCAFLKSNPDMTRVAAVEAFRRIPCSANRTALVHLYQSADESEEIRIASYYTAMRCPSQELLHIVQQILKHEKSTQVGSFVWSHLSQLLESDDPLKQEIAYSLPDDILSKDFEGESWKYSTYTDATIYSESVGANVEASLVFTPSSFIPRSVMGNLTIHAMGRAVNILELGIRLENAEDLLKMMFGHHSSTLSKVFVGKDEEDRNTDSESPIETVTKANYKKPTSKRYTSGEHPEKKHDQQKMKESKHSCPSGKYNKLNELQQKFTQGLKNKKRELKCGLSMKIFGNELSFLDCDGIRDKMKTHSLSMAELAVKLLKGQEVQYSKRLSLATEEFTFPALSGFPVQISLNATASTNIKVKGNMDFKHQTNFFLNGYIKPSALIQISAQMGIAGVLGKMGLKWVTGIKAMNSLDGGIQVKKGQDIKMFLNTPEESMEILNFSSTLYQVSVDGLEKISNPSNQRERKACLNEEVSKLFGWQPCLEVSYPDADSLLTFPLSGPAKATIVLRKQDKGLRQYLLEASYNYVSQKDDWFPNEASLHFFMGTPKSEVRRDVGIDLYYNVQHRKFRLKLLHPKKKIQIDGKMESSRNSRNVHLELIIDDKEIYYIKGITDLQTVGGEQRYTALAEAKLSKHGSPIIISGNITKQFGKKMAFSIAVNNLLKDTAFLSVLVEKKADDKLKQYSLEGEAYVPGVFGSYAIGLLQKRGNLWTNAMRVKYGLLGDAKHLRHECDSGQKIRMDTDSDEQYRLDMEHELHCTQMPSSNHKIHFHHEEQASHIHSRLEMSYGKHWDEINNKKKLFISQTFKNNSNPSTANYFMEFTLQVAEKQVNYRTQLLHTHSALESNTNFKVQYNDQMPFVAGLQWKDASKNDLCKLEGAFTMDTPWLYLYSALKHHQPQRYAYQTTVEVSAGKALSIKNLVLEMFYKDKGSEKEGRIHIHTPTVTYLRASTINFVGGNAFRSYSEMVSLWNQLLKNEIHLENNEKIKLLCIKIKGSKQEFNFTVDHRSVDWPKKSNFSIKTVWTDQKNPPLVFQLDGQIEEVRKEKMLYEKQGLIHIRHPFKLPVPQSVLLQETFTVDKRKKRYMLETKLLLNGKEECVQTIILGYHTDNPYICADLNHPFKDQVFPNNFEMCASTKRYITGKQEAKATIKVNKKDVFGLTGTFQNKSSKRELWHVLRMDMTHSFQLKFPRGLVFDGEVFSRQMKQDDFDHVLRGKIIINRNDTLQVHSQLNRSLNQISFFSQFIHPYQLRVPQDLQVRATARRYGTKNVNGTFSLHWGDKGVVSLEIDLANDSRKNIGIIALNVSLRQTVLAVPLAAHLRIIGKAFPSRISLLSEINFNDKSLLIDLLGLKEQKVGFLLSLNGNLMHNIDDLTCIPHQLSVNGFLKQKKNINEGYIRFIKNQELYVMHLRNRNVFGNSSLHNITFTLTQNGSNAFPAETTLRAQVQLEELDKNGQICIQMDEKLLCMDLSNAGDQEHRDVKGLLSHNIVSLQNAGIPMEGTVEVTLQNSGNNRTFGVALERGNNRVEVSLGLEKSSAQSQIMSSLKHNIGDLKYNGIPYIIDGICYYQNSNKRLVSGVSVYVEDEHIKAEVQKKTIGSASNIILSFHNDLSSINNIIPSSMKVVCNAEVTANLLYGHCHGEVSRRTFEISAPAKAIFNGSLLANGYKTSLFGLVSSGDAFARLSINTESGLYNTMEIGFKHALSQLQMLGIAKDNKIRISSTRLGRNSALLDITIGKCLLKCNAEAKTDSNGSDGSSLNWNTSVINSCSLLEKLHFPKSLFMNGSLQRNPCDFALSVKLGYEGKDASLHLKTSCDPYILKGSLNHSIHQLNNIGLPTVNQIMFSASSGPSLGGQVLLQSGQCSINAEANIKSSKKTEWMIHTETDCKMLKDIHIPSQSQVNGSFVINGCEAELLCAFTFNGNISELQVRTECQPKLKVEMLFRHNLLLLKEINEESKLSISVGKQSNYNIDMLLKSGTCAIEIKGDVHAENKLQWKMFLENRCKAIQELGAPLKIDGSGYIVVNKKANLDSQMLIVVDESTLQGILILKATEKRQELDAILTHNVQPAINLGIPTKTMVDVTTERSSELYRRSIQLNLDSKQITEEMNFQQKADHITFRYQIAHNLELLKKLPLEDILEIQATVDLKDTRNVSVTAQYGPRFINSTMQIRGNETRTNLTGNVNHNLPWLLQSGIPASIQTSVDIQVMEGKREISVHTSAAETLIMCTVATLCTAEDNKVLFRSVHNSEAFQMYGFPKVAGVTGRLSTESNKSSAALKVELDKKKLIVDISTIKLQMGSFEVAAGVEHSVPVLLGLGLPSTTQMVLQLISTKVDIGGIWKLNYDNGTHIFITANARTEQQRNELIIKAVHNEPFLLHYIPNSSNLITRVSFSMNDAGGIISLKMEEKEFHLSTKFNFSGNIYSKTLHLEHSVPQLKNLPSRIELRTVYDKSHKAYILKHATILGSKELTLVGSYTGQFPKLSGAHEIMGEFSQSLLLSSLRHGKVNVHVEHSTHNHQDHIAIGWDSNDQVDISSSLKMGKERFDCRVGFSHPFDFAIRQLDVRTSSERKWDKYNHQTQVSWNKGHPVNLTITLEDKLVNDSKVWNACVSVMPGQIQQLLGVRNLEVCGYMEKASNTFHEYVNMRWDSKKIRQGLLYEKNNGLNPDMLQLEATLENIFLVGCSKQHILTKIDTNYLDTMNHILKLEFCDLPHPVVISGKHHLNKEELLFSEARINFSPYEKDDTLFALALNDDGIGETQNYSFSLNVKASEDVQMGVMGRYVFSSANHNILLQGSLIKDEKWILNASSGKKCLQVNIAQHGQGSSSEKGVELSACTDTKHLAAVNSYLNVNGVQDKLGHFVLSTSNQSLHLSYQGCGNTITKAENFLGNLASHMKIQFLEMNKKFDNYIKKFQKIVQQYEFLHEAAGWPMQISQDIEEFLQQGPKTFNQMWKLSSLRQSLRHGLPVYFEQLHNLVKQIQTELQRPLETLKDAYYDATLKPLEEVWQEKTDDCLRKINAFLPSIIKDKWLMEPFRHLLGGLKAGIDMGTHQLLKWTDAKLSRAVNKIRKPLTSLFGYSSNCTVNLNFPVLPKEYHLTDLANITHYIIEEKLMKPLKNMYSVNPMAEYYRFKRRMMESPFEHHALLIGNKHIVTFDGIIFDLNSKCSLLLAKDFIHNNFTVILKQGSGILRSLHVEMNDVAVDIYPGLKVEDNCQSLDLPFVKNGITIKKDANKIKISNQEGTAVSCDNRHDICSITLEGWNHGVSAGLFGTNDNESGNDFLLPDLSYTNSTQDFTLKWQVDSQCSFGWKKTKACPTAPHQKFCKALFQGTHSVLRNCFRVIYPAPFYNMCVEDICDSSDIKPICNLAAAYVHLCNRNFVPIEIPSQCA
ncbi:uncharacterized protein WCC33_013385 [Rhinophrynus dorsalis]